MTKTRPDIFFLTLCVSSINKIIIKYSNNNIDMYSDSKYIGESADQRTRPSHAHTSHVNTRFANLPTNQYAIVVVHQRERARVRKPADRNTVSTATRTCRTSNMAACFCTTMADTSNTPSYTSTLFDPLSCWWWFIFTQFAVSPPGCTYASGRARTAARQFFE